MIAEAGHPMPTTPIPSSAIAWIRARTPRAIGAAVADLGIPAAGYAALAVIYNEVLVRHIDRLLATSRITLMPNDLNGTLWLYWWVHRALGSDAAVQRPDVLCWPEGEALGTNFPNVIDALLAAPFVALYGIPAGFNAFLLAIPALGALAGYLCLRTLTRHRALAWCAGAFLGFNAYTIFEIRMGRPATALLITLPLFVAAWTLALRTRGRRGWIWVAVAGLLAALATYHYIPFAIWLGLFALLTAAGRTAFPARGLARLRAPLALATVGVLCLVISFPYLLRTRSIQLRSEDNTPGAWSGEQSAAEDGLGAGLRSLWQDLRQPARPGPTGPPGRDEDLERLQRTAMPYDYLWRERGQYDRELELPVPWLLLALTLVAGLAGGRRARGWLFCALLFWTFTLGPHVSAQAGNELAPVRIGDGQLATPMLLLAKTVPLAGHFLWPFRAVPMMLLCLTGTLVVAVDVTVGRLRGAPGTPRPPIRRALPWVLMAISLLALALGLDVNRRQGLLTLDYTDWRPHPFLSYLAEQDGDLQVIDLPLGLGEGTALQQVIHGQPRPEVIRGELIRNSQSAPTAFETCLDAPFLQALWYLGRDGSTAERARANGLTRQAALETAGGRTTFVLIHVAAFDELRREQLFVNPRRVASELEVLLGPPMVDDAELIAFQIPSE